MGRRATAEATRRAALDLGREADCADVMGWAHEMRAWYALTSGNYRGAITAARAGTDIAPRHTVAVQLAAQEAKAWARIHDRRQVEVALDRGRALLDQQPPPDNLDNHFVVDPAKFDFYAMDCYRLVNENHLAQTYADEVIRVGTDLDGRERAPMRIAEARVTLGAVAARQGDLEQAVAHGRRALDGERKSLPSLLMVSRELGGLLERQYSAEPVALEYLDQLRSLCAPAGTG